MFQLGHLQNICKISICIVLTEICLQLNKQLGPLTSPYSFLIEKGIRISWGKSQNPLWYFRRYSRVASLRETRYMNWIFFAQICIHYSSYTYMHKVNIMRDLKSYISTFHAYLNKYICQKLSAFQVSVFRNSFFACM